MTNAERKVRLNVATEISERVHSDLCNDHTDQVSRETTYELADIIRYVYKRQPLLICLRSRMSSRMSQSRDMSG